MTSKTYPQQQVEAAPERALPCPRGYRVATGKRGPMHKPRVPMTPTPGYTALAEIPGRALVFLQAIATRPPIRVLMSQGGFTAKDHTEGWTLLSRACEYQATSSTEDDQFRAQRAMAEIHDWVTQHFPRLRAALERLHPEWIELFPQRDTRHPEQSLLGLACVIERLGHAEQRRDAALLATLERRGLGRRAIERLAGLVRDAQRLGEVSGDETDIDARTQELVALYRWYRDWAETAKRVVRRKDYRISLGLVGRRACRPHSEGSTGERGFSARGGDPV
ncbi:MAG: hypothetical protein JW940_03285 [Polyangiaceae bacterium]|nr:hypothetical protein [Polyangiaceae bacterium]